ncbi:MAG TPA: T9SS type A sorting domain-containing protein [Chitinophagaceae bacterium]|nr:T9SS type A sorting domain-containing protein [Chitinophagaceae bacterium]
MKKVFTLKFLFPVSLFLLFGLQASSQSLTENFSYTAGTLLTANGWAAHSGAGTNAITVTSPSLTYAGHPGSGVGNAISMTTSGEDDNKTFTAITTGTAYASFLVNVTAATATGDYFIGLWQNATTFPSRIYAKSSGGGFVFGIGKQAGTAVYESTVRTFGTTYLIATNYIYNPVAQDDAVNLWVNPALGMAEPLATIANVTAANADATTIAAFYVRQGTAASASTQRVDAILVGTTWASVTPVLTPTTTSISPSSATVGDPGFTLTVNGTNFANNNSTVTWNGSNRTTTFISELQLTASIPASDLSAAGTATVGVTTTGAPASNTQTFTINPASGATLTLTSPLTGFGNVCINTTTAANSFTLDGNNLNGSNISLASLSGFTYSETLGGTYTSTLSFTYAGTSFTGKVIYVKFSPTAVQSYNGDISLSGGGLVSSYPVAATGAGVNDAPTVTTGGSSSVAATSAVAAGTINADGCAVVTAYGIEYSINSGFPDGTGTQVPASNLAGGNFSSTITGLAPNTRYYYKAYATNSIGTAYGTQQAFTCTALPVPMAGQPSLSYTEDFADIANWSNFFITGTGANHFSGLGATGAGGIPNGTTITTSTLSFQGAGFGSSGGVQKGTDQVPPTQSIVLLSTGATDNTSSAAIDFYMDFTGVNAGTVSFDWASVNNSTGDRNGSMRVYTSTDGIVFTELTFASVLNFTNNFPTNGTKANIALPSSFNNSPTARLRFYYHNGTGGVTPTGSRPKISIDNLNVTAVATTPCVSPTAPATSLVFGTITDVSIQASFTAASPASDGYLVVMSTNSSLTSNPVDGQIYNIGDNVGDGSVVAKGSSTSFTATGLAPLTTYYFFIFPMNSVCTGGPLYYTTTVLTGSATTTAGLPPCAAPASQPTSLVFGTIGTNSIQGSFTSTTADKYLVLRSVSASLSNNPVNGTTYNTGDILGNATVVQSSNATSFTASGLSPNTIYHFYIFSLNSLSCTNGPAYNTTSPLTGSQSTNPLPPCTTPPSQPSALTFNASRNAISGAFTPASGADDYLVIASTSSTLSTTPVDNTDYNEGDNLGGGVVVSSSSANSFLAAGLTPGTTYYFYIFAANKNCSGGTKYLVTSPLTGNKITTSDPVNSFYFGTLHSHSAYSDGNKDNLGFIPTDDYNYAMTSLCLDYLGISEHNHFSSPANPGNKLSTYHLGISQANTFTAGHPNFLALYGMEWGVISGGGHVLIYGDGMDDLWGWESGSGGWGATNNYDVYVAKSDYTGASGLFKTVNDNIATNTFASLAHPNLTDYNNIAGTAYNTVADNAITSVAVESGPATSTNTTYSNPGSSMFYLFYYQALLAKGFHLGPAIDHDNHYTTFGHTTYSRTGLIAPSLTKTEIIAANRNMHFYATQDCDTKVDFTVNTKIMGSIFIDRYAPVISVTLTDATTNLSGAIIRVMYGVPGSGIVAVKIDSAIGSSLKFIDNSIADLSTGYYYIDISNGATRIVTSPVWYTRNDANGTLPVTITSFSAQKQNTTTLLKWTTVQELNSREFVIERSVNGANWQPIATIAAAGNSASTLNYVARDLNPVKGVNLYRLKSVDLDNKFVYSAIRRVDFENKYTYSIYPNPASDIIQITTDNTSGINATVQILNSQGQALISKQMNSNMQPALINISSLSSGIYIMKIITADGSVSVQKFSKQ